MTETKPLTVEIQIGGRTRRFIERAMLFLAACVFSFFAAWYLTML